MPDRTGSVAVCIDWTRQADCGRGGRGYQRIMTSLLTTLAELERRYNELDHLMADPSIATDPSQLTELGRERAELDPIVAAYREFRANETAIDEIRLMAEDDDSELAALADEELKSLQSRHTELEKEIRTLLV